MNPYLFGNFDRAYITAARQILGLSQERMAVYLGISVSTWRRAEQEGLLRRRTADRLADALCELVPNETATGRAVPPISPYATPRHLQNMDFIFFVADHLRGLDPAARPLDDAVAVAFTGVAAAIGGNGTLGEDGE